MCQKFSNILDYNTPKFYSQPSENVHLVIIFIRKNLDFSDIMHLVRARINISLIKLKLQGTSATRAPSTALGGAPAMP